MTDFLESIGAGSGVRVRRLHAGGHVRTPWYVQGREGVVVRTLGRWPNPEILASGREDPLGVDLYSVEFDQTDVWAEYSGSRKDRIVVDIYGHWLEPRERPGATSIAKDRTGSE